MVDTACTPGTPIDLDFAANQPETKPAGEVMDLWRRPGKSTSSLWLCLCCLTVPRGPAVLLRYVHPLDLAMNAAQTRHALNKAS